jgi:hypothetical protein
MLHGKIKGAPSAAYQIDLGENPGVTQAQALSVSWSSNWIANRDNQNYVGLINAGFSPYAAFGGALRAYNAGLQGTINTLSTPGPGMVNLNWGTANGNYVSGVLNIWINCFGGGRL